MSETSAFETFERMSQKVDQIEAEADAMKELEDVSQNASLEKQFKELEASDTSSTLLLESLKEKMRNEGELQ